MIVYLLVSITLFIASFSLCLLIKADGDFIQRGSAMLLGISMAAFIYLYGTWVYLSIYLRYLFAISVLTVLLFYLLKKRQCTGTSRTWKVVLNIAFSSFFLLLSILYFTGTTGKPETIALAFPLRKGTYFVLQGGKGLPTNFFHYSYRGAVYAIDITRLNRFGNRAAAIFSDRLMDYHIFNDTVYSPCNGIIAQARDENPDNIPPDRTRGPSNTNAILIETDAFYVFMAHLKYKGVFVKEGQQVRVGQPIGLVGNSGFTLEPHLHIQAHKNTGKSGWYREDPLFIQFDGKEYLLFEVIHPKNIKSAPEK